METRKPIAILGAGMAGLTAANFLRQNEVPFILYEAGDKIAGLASSFKDKDGFSYDFGAHFVTNRLADAIGISSECRVVKHYGEAVWFNGKSYGYPFGLIKIPLISLSFIKAKIQSLHNGDIPKSAAEWFGKRYGKTFAQEIALPLVEAWSGVPSNLLSPAVGESLPTNITKAFYLKAASFITRRAVACGYNREMPEMPSVWHVYPHGGVSTLCTKLAEGLEDSIRLKSPVQEILVENEKVVAVRVNGEIHEVSAVISTAPANILAKMVKGTEVLESIKQFRFRPMVFVNMRFKGRNLLPETVLWFPQKKFPFFRVTDVTRSMPWLAPDGKSIVTVDIGCQLEDELWTMDEEQLTMLCLKHIKAVIPDAEKRILGSSILRTPIAYPVFLSEYEKERQDFERSTKIENLLSIGRNGEFSHRFMEDVYWRTRKKVQDLIKIKPELRKNYSGNDLTPTSDFFNNS
ncbi:MAG: protoporphyrinogen/coproporphyrinogen oxidase [Chitinophagales bacterium]